MIPVTFGQVLSYSSSRLEGANFTTISRIGRSKLHSQFFIITVQGSYTLNIRALRQVHRNAIYRFLFRLSIFYNNIAPLLVANE